MGDELPTLMRQLNHTHIGDCFMPKYVLSWFVDNGPVNQTVEALSPDDARLSVHNRYDGRAADTVTDMHGNKWMPRSGGHGLFQTHPRQPIKAA